MPGWGPGPALSTVWPDRRAGALPAREPRTGCSRQPEKRGGQVWRQSVGDAVRLPLSAWPAGQPASPTAGDWQTIHPRLFVPVGLMTSTRGCRGPAPWRLRRREPANRTRWPRRTGRAGSDPGRPHRGLGWLSMKGRHRRPRLGPGPGRSPTLGLLQAVGGARRCQAGLNTYLLSLDRAGARHWPGPENCGRWWFLPRPWPRRPVPAPEVVDYAGPAYSRWMSGSGWELVATAPGEPGSLDSTGGAPSGLRYYVSRGSNNPAPSLRPGAVTGQAVEHGGQARGSIFLRTRPSSVAMTCLRRR